MLSAALLPGPHVIQRMTVRCCGTDALSVAAGAADCGAVDTLLSVGVSDESLSVVTILLRQPDASLRQPSRPDWQCRDYAAASHDRMRERLLREAESLCDDGERMRDTIGAQGAIYHLICVSNVPVSTISNFISP
jgi:hypothetical protein